MTGRDDEPFLSRWSRRKVAARTAEPAPPATTPDARDTDAADTGAPTVPLSTDPAVAPGTVDADRARHDAARSPGTRVDAASGGTQPASAPAALPDLDTLDGVRSDYREFMRPGVDDTTRRAALRKLFADPHFNQMDGLDVYIDDYSKPDPMPAAMLAALNVTRRLLVDPASETPEALAAAAAEGAAEASPAESSSASPVEPEKQASSASATRVASDEDSTATPADANLAPPSPSPSTATDPQPIRPPSEDRT